jgi:hypothetical protein
MPDSRSPGFTTTTRTAANQRRPPNPSSGILAVVGGGRFGVERIGEAANEDLEVSLGAQNPDCCDWGVEGAKRNDEPGSNLGIMKRKSEYCPPFKDEGELIASWGEARLITYLDGKSELKCGTKEDRLAAHEWISLFWHEAVIGEG